MKNSWWQYRQWRFVADMNRDGAVTGGDVPHWFEWLFFMPGDALIALVGPTWLGPLLDLTPKSFGGGTSALLSVAAWLIALWMLFYLFLFVLDAADPTLRADWRERREAERLARRVRKERERRLYGNRFLRRAGRWLFFALVVAAVAAFAWAFVKDLL